METRMVKLENETSMVLDAGRLDWFIKAGEKAIEMMYCGGPHVLQYSSGGARNKDYDRLCAAYGAVLGVTK